MSLLAQDGDYPGLSWYRSWRKWGLWREPRSVVILVVSVDLLGLIAAAVALSTLTTHTSSFLRISLLLGLALVFDETSRTVDRLRLRITEGVYVDMTSVWLLAGAIVLPAAYAVILVVVVRAHMWWRHQRRNGMHAHRQIFTAASMMLGCLACGVLIRHVSPAIGDGSSALTSAAIVVIGLLAYTVINTVLVSGIMYLASTPKRVSQVLGSWEDNALELATLCLGALTALAVLHQPWLTVLALPPMFTLQRSALVKELEHAASTDGKTGLLNAIAWEQIAKRELSRADRDHSPAAVLIIDLDHFKAVNDAHGHLVGDIVLREVGRCLTRELRDYDSVGRFGGEEFVAVLPDVRTTVAVEIAERIRRHINELRPSGLTGSRPGVDEMALSASIGVAVYRDHGTDLQQLLSAADAALYRAKNAGRNRVELAWSGPAKEREAAI
jgi:diguanylate cyclase (GGDEF)-like protein